MVDNFAAGKTAKSEQTRKRIIHTFLSLIDEKKWDKITVKELCARSEITRGTFYQYYSDIYELMEQIQESLLSDIQTRFAQIQSESRSGFPIEEFLEKFDYEPPQNLIVWFDFCKDNQDAIRALLDLQNGDIYFEKKLKHLLIDTINEMMDTDCPTTNFGITSSKLFQNCIFSPPGSGWNLMNPIFSLSRKLSTY